MQYQQRMCAHEGRRESSEKDPSNLLCGVTESRLILQHERSSINLLVLREEVKVRNDENEVGQELSTCSDPQSTEIPIKRFRVRFYFFHTSRKGERKKGTSDATTYGRYRG